jgi:hypothetical protein
MVSGRALVDAWLRPALAQPRQPHREIRAIPLAAAPAPANRGDDAMNSTQVSMISASAVAGGLILLLIWLDPIQWL